MPSTQQGAHAAGGRASPPETCCRPVTHLASRRGEEIGCSAPTACNGLASCWPTTWPPRPGSGRRYCRAPAGLADDGAGVEQQKAGVAEAARPVQPRRYAGRYPGQQGEDRGQSRGNAYRRRAGERYRWADRCRCRGWGYRSVAPARTVHDADHDGRPADRRPGEHGQCGEVTSDGMRMPNRTRRVHTRHGVAARSSRCIADFDRSSREGRGLEHRRLADMQVSAATRRAAQLGQAGRSARGFAARVALIVCAEPTLKVQPVNDEPHGTVMRRRSRDHAAASRWARSSSSWRPDHRLLHAADLGWPRPLFAGRRWRPVDHGLDTQVIPTSAAASSRHS